MVMDQRVIMFILSIAMLLIGLLYKYYIDAKATIIEYLWAYELFFSKSNKQSVKEVTI
jgi:hypothetical protein